MRRVILAGVLALSLLGALWYGHAPPRSVTAYDHRAAQTVEYLRSQVQTARLWAGAVARGDATHQAVRVSLIEAEADATATTNRFAGWTPPAGGGVRDAVLALAQRVVEALAQLRIVAEQDRWPELSAAMQPLSDLATQLERLRQELSR